MKKLLIIIPLLFILIGCTNKEEENKIAYLEYKNDGGFPVLMKNFRHSSGCLRSQC